MSHKPSEMTASDVWPSIVGDQMHGSHIQIILTIIARMPPNLFHDAISRILRETAMGPMLDPTAYLDGVKWKNARDYVEILEALEKVRKLVAE